MEQSDEELALLLNHGDRKAFETIYKRYSKYLFKYVRGNIAAKEDCEEIIQEVFVSLWARHKSLRILSLKYYLLTMVQYKIVHYIRHKAVKKKYEDHYRFFEMMYCSIEEGQRTPESIQTALRNAISDLPERCQVAIKLRIFENLTNGEIAERMEVTKRTVEVYMTQAFRHFRSHYETIYGIS